MDLEAPKRLRTSKKGLRRLIKAMTMVKRDFSAPKKLRPTMKMKK
jgi:hypothetical protein